MNKTSAAIVRTLLLGTSCLSVLGLGLDAARAQPTGGNVVLGSASIADHGGNSTTINQTTGKAVINWNSFSIAAGGTVQFNQPGASAITLNRVIGPESSAIYGKLLANGQVWLINGNGVLFGKGSRINVGGLIATTADIRDGDFASGNYAFSGGTGASVVNQGTIKAAKGGSVVLSGASVSNQGLIQAETGTVVLGGASAFTVDFVGDGLIKYAIAAPAGKADNGETGVANSGTISAQGGHVIMTARAAANVADAVVNNTGMISATSAKVANGEVVLDGGDGDVAVSGTIDASGTGSGQTGGSVAVTGRNVTVADNTNINVSGDAGGGSVKIGGDAHGAGPLQNAANTHVGSATITADAISRGNGGTLVVWSNGLTDFSGIFSAKGGASGGDGGFVETSGHTLNIGPQAKIDTTAPRGQTGTWLLDPDYIVISAGEGNNTQLTGGTLALGTDPGDTDQVRPATIVNALNTTNVTLEAVHDITVLNPVLYSSSHSLSLLAEGNITVSANIQNSLASGGGAINLIAGWDGATTDFSNLTLASGAFGNNSGAVTIGGTSSAAVGSASGTTTVAGYNVRLLAQSNDAYGQIGYRGAGGGAIAVLAQNEVSLFAGEGTNSLAMIGNGDKLGSVAGPVTGDIAVSAGNDLRMQVYTGGTLWVGNSATGGETGDLLIASDSVVDASCCGFEGQGSLSPMIAADLAGGDVTWQSTSDIVVTAPIVYGSTHALSLLAQNDIIVEGSIQNTLASGGGTITLAAGWDGTTAAPSILTTPGAYGNTDFCNNITGEIDLQNQVGDNEINVAVGSASGETIVAAAQVNIGDSFNGGGFAQIGYHGAGGGDIVVRTTGDLNVQASDSDFAMIGNGSLDNDVSGDVTGNIDIRVGGAISLFMGEGSSNAVPWIGNVAGEDFSETGNVILVSANTDGESDVDFTQNIAADLQGGDFLLGVSDVNQTAEVGDFFYSAPHTLSIVATGEVDIEGNIQNSGTGAINIIGGWDGTTVDAAHLTDPGAYGNGTGWDGAVLIDGCGCEGSASVGSWGGKVTVAGSFVDLEAENGYAQIGYTGAGGGDIAVLSTGDIVLDGNIADFGAYAQIGNGAPLGSIGGPVTGNIFVSAAGSVVLASDAGLGCDCDEPPPPAPVLIGNASGDDDVPPPYSGNVAIFASDIDDSGMLDGFGFGDSLTHDIVGGDFTVGFTDPENGIRIHDDFIYNSPHALNLLSAGNITFDASVQNSGSGAITLVAGWNGDTDLGDVLAGGFYGNNEGTIFVGGPNANGPLAVGTASGPLAVYGANLVVDGTNGTAQLGFHGAGGGNIFVNMTDNILVVAGTDEGDGDYSAQIGNGSLLNDVSGNVTGDIAMTAGGFTSFFTSDVGMAWLGNVASDGFKATGNVTALTQSGFFEADFIDADLGTSADTGGNVFLGFTDPSVSPLFAGGIDYNSPHDFTFAGAGSLNVTGSIMNAGTGAVTLVAGWDGQTVGSAAQIAAANAFGHNNAFIAVGNASQFENISVGSAGGVTTLLTHDLTVAPKAGYYAQVGYHGTGSGAVVIDALGSISLSGNSAAEFAQIGSGTTFGSNASSGNVTLTAQTITTGADSAVTAAALTATLTGTGGSIGASGAPLRIAANTANVTTNGGSVFLTSPSNGVTLAGVSLNGGALTLSAGGAIAQTAAIHVGALNVSTTTGAITLLNGGNSFGALTVATQGSDAASLTSSGPIVVAGAQVSGTLTLNANGTISQTGALTAGGLVLSANGAIALNNAGNSFATLALTTAGTNNASVTDSTAVALGASTVGGALTLASGGAISQTGAITAGELVLSANGTIVLNNSGNSVATLAVTTSGVNDASLADATAVTLGASTVGGRLTLNAGGAVAQSGVLATHGLNLSTTSGGIMLTNTGNAVAGLVQFNAPGAVSFYNALATNVGTSLAGGDLTLLAKGNVNFLGSVQSNTGNVTAVAGWDGTTTNAALFGNAGVFGNNNAALTVGGTGAPGNVAVGSKSGTTSIYAWLVNVGGAHGYAQLGYHGSGGGAILVRTLQNMNLTGGVGYAMLGNGSLTADVTGNITGDIDVRVGGSANFSSGGGSAIAWFGNVAHSGTESGNGILLLNEESDTNESDALANFISADLAGGDFTLGFTGLGDQGPDHNVGYTSAHTFNLLVAGNAVMAGSIQNAGTGAINLVAGWDGHTLSGFGAAGVSGNGGHGVVIGGGDASGGVAFGSAGSTSLYGASLALNAVNGYAQLGFNGHGSGAILVNVTGGVTLTGGAASGEFAQIGNGGLKTSGNNSGDITIVAGGDLALNGGAGSEAYAQVGEGGAESNTGSSGYNNTAAITVTAANVLLNAGGGSAAYTMIGNGGYKSGLNLAGAGVNGGNITITSGHAVLLHGNGADAFAQIGNGGSQSNLNPSAAATGTDSGDIVVHAPNGAAGAVTLAAGTGANSYAQIGNGGYAVNSGGGAVAANFTITGNVSVTDLSLTGGNGGANSFADIGNGDASLNSVGNISGNIFIDANGQITFVNGTAPHSPATIGNFTGLGLIVGLLTGVQLPSDISTNPAALGVIASNTANNKSNTNGITTISTIAITPPEGAPPGATDVGGGTGALGPIAMLDNGNDSTAPNTSDNATVVIADSLDGTKKAVSSQTILAGMLKQTSPTGAGQTVHGVPSADQDFSSEGNEAFWQ